MQPSSKSWFRNAILYQIYPRSFYDSDGNGIGDLRGIIQKLPYLNGEENSLGINVIWLSPIYPSPLADFGYDVSDYCAIDPMYGNFDDFKELIDKAHLRGIKVLIDFIPNHTSDQHSWFQESKQSKDSSRRDWYVWHDADADGGPPNNWQSVFGGSAWEYDETTNQYYLHSFLKEQPDLNWENAGVRHAIDKAMRFWLDMGVDGFRVDAVYWISKDLHFRDDPINPNPDQIAPYYQLLHRYSRNGPKLIEYINGMAKTLKAYPERFMVVEASPDHSDKSEWYLKLYQQIDPSVCAPFNFTGIHTVWHAAEFKDFIDKFQRHMHPDYVPVYCMSNHDKARLVARLGKRAARSSAVMQMTLPGMPVVYYGDELGMDNSDIPPALVQDPFGKRVPGMGRDPSRTPFLWNSTKNAGFSTGQPWLPVDADYLRNNLESQLLDPDSFITLYRSLIKLRKKYPSLQHGSYKSLDLQGEIFIYIREHGNEKMVIALNFSDKKLEAVSPELKGHLIFSSEIGHMDKKIKDRLWLAPHEAVLISVLVES